ncbi:phosphopantetheine-binding protein, partial [Massilia sp. DJPM01]|uniref:phosphopantetheine-binding protein n=1 Tax=Massilia sp. DJPM01 TaxID=3024404 RepID=UPI00259DE38F
MRDNFGLVPMDNAAGMAAFYQALASGQAQVLVAAGERNKLLAVFGGHAAPVPVAALAADKQSVIPDQLVDLNYKLATVLLQLVSSLIKVKPEDIDLDSELSEYGFDSISLTELANKLNQEYGLELMPTLFFEHGTVSSLATYLVEAHQAVFARRFGSRASAAAAMPQPQTAAAPVQAAAPVSRRSRFGTPSAVTAALPEAIAIVGMSGCMPMADDLDAFWTNLVEGRDCISEIPASRWDWQAMFGDP